MSASPGFFPRVLCHRSRLTSRGELHSGPSENMRKLYLLAGVLIFSLYIVYDTQTIVGGEHKNFQFDMDDYVLAALVIYLDIINLFILLLQLLQGGRRD